MRSDTSGAITGSMLRDIAVCERRAWHDVHADPGLRDQVASFVQLLWAEGVAHEGAVLSSLHGIVVDLRNQPPAVTDRATMGALVGSADHILGARIAVEDLVGKPDIISRVDGVWTAGDVKSGNPLMADGRRPKLEYAVQIGLYAHILSRLRVGSADRAFVIGADGRTSYFDLDAPWGNSSVHGIVDAAILRARQIHTGAAITRGESASKCGLCHWRTLCRAELEAADDLTLLAQLGRKLRRAVEQVAANRSELVALDLRQVELPGGKTSVAGVGLARLRRFQDRARLQKTPGARPYARSPLDLSRAPLEFHLDIEADPSRGNLVYLHGIWERSSGDDGVQNERFVHFFADGPGGERKAFAKTWAFLASHPEAMTYYYSPYERTSYRALQRRYPDVCTAEQVEAFFASPRVVDLYTDIVAPKTEWPLGSYGIKAIAKYLGFHWAAEDASGASSIAWYDEWVRLGEPELRERIIDYNRSDCIASAIVLDALIALPVTGPPPWLSANGLGGPERCIRTPE